jgi:hypothetical protein
MIVGNWGFTLNFNGPFSAFGVTADDKVNRDGGKGKQTGSPTECDCVTSELASLYGRT